MEKNKGTNSLESNSLILIIDDEEAILKTLKDALTDEDYKVETLSDGNKALDLIGKSIPDLILLDIFMPNCNGLKLLTQIKKEFPDQKVIIISGFGNIPIAIEATKKGAIDFIEKPLNLDEILNKISFLKTPPSPEEERSETKSNESLKKYNIRGKLCLIGESNLFLELIQQAERLAPHHFPIIIYGEHGTGKTSLANYIFAKSKKNSFEKISCETLEKNICEKIFGEFFESKKETPSPSEKTLFLKNIDLLNAESQKTLLSFLEDNQSQKPRIIVSSKESLFHLVQKKLFNESLFYHLNKAPLEVPPLRKRPYDIPLLINFFINHYNEIYKKKSVLTTQSIRLLRNQPWHGNVCELKQVIQQIVASNKNYKVVSPEDIVSILGEKKMHFVENQSILQFNSLEEATSRFKKNFLLYLLRKNHYNISQVSQRLSLSLSQLKNELLELKIDLRN